MNDFTVLQGLENLDKIDTSIELAFDCETTGLRPTRGGLRLLQLGSLARKTILLIDCFELEDNGWEALQLLAGNGDRYWLAHNAVFDIGWLAEHDIHLRGHIGCTMIASKLLNNGLGPKVRHSLADLSRRYLKRELDKELQRSDWSGELTWEQLQYAAKDVQTVLELSTPLEVRLRNAGLMGAYGLECGVLPAIAEMQRCGLPWDKEALQQTKADYEHDIETLGKDFVMRLDAALPEEHKLPRDDDGSFNLRARDEGRISDGTRATQVLISTAPSSWWIGSRRCWVRRRLMPQETQRVEAALRAYAADHEVVQIYLEEEMREAPSNDRVAAQVSYARGTCPRFVLAAWR